jgi:hypothetical protein
MLLPDFNLRLFEPVATRSGGEPCRDNCRNQAITLIEGVLSVTEMLRQQLWDTAG